MTDFFSVPQKEILIAGRQAKSPLFYRSVRLFSAVFFADYKATRSLLPKGQDYRLLTPDGIHALVSVVASQFQDSGVGPYNEVSFAAALFPPGRSKGSWIEIARSLLNHSFHAHVLQMPVNTEMAYRGGVDYFNFPKWVSNIHFEEGSDSMCCEVRDSEKGHLLYALEGKKIQTRSLDQVQSFHTYPFYRGNKSHALFRVRLLEAGKQCFGGPLVLRFGEGERADEMTRLRLSAPVFYTFAPHCEAILFETDGGANG